MSGIQIIVKDKKGNIKQDYEMSRTVSSGKVIKINELKEKQIKEKKKEKK